MRDRRNVKVPLSWLGTGTGTLPVVDPFSGVRVVVLIKK